MGESTGAVMKPAWKKPLEIVRYGLMSLGWDVSPALWGDTFLYHTGARKGSVNLHERHNPGHAKRWRFDVDCCATPKGQVFPEHYIRPTSYSGPDDKHEISVMAPEVLAISQWLVGWIQAYEAGDPLPDMPDGTRYPGGRIFTKATRVHLGWGLHE